MVVRTAKDGKDHTVTATHPDKMNERTESRRTRRMAACEEPRRVRRSQLCVPSMIMNITASTIKADDREQSAGHEFAGLDRVSIAEEDEKADRENQAQGDALVLDCAIESARRSHGHQGTDRAGDQRSAAAGLQITDQAPHREQTA